WDMARWYPAHLGTLALRDSEPGSESGLDAMSSPGDLIEIPQVAASLGAVFRAAGHELHMVGGTVRDALMQRPDTDLDFTTDALPAQVLAIVEPIASAIWKTGIEFGTISLQLQGRLCEITTYRADQYDRVSRNPEVAYGDSLVDD